MPAQNGTLYWSISRDSTAGDLFIKVSAFLFVPFP